MGEAKRRKQLGLMPTVYPFEAELSRNGQVTLTRAPEDASFAPLIVQALESTQMKDDAWDSEFRTALVFSGAINQRLNTAADVERIETPQFRRLIGEVVLGKSAGDLNAVALDIPGGAVRLRDQFHSFDGKKWESFPDIRDPERIFQALQTHPAFNLEGEALGQFRVEQFAEGRIDIDPEPPEGTLDILEEIGREWHGDTPEKWAELHAEQVDGDEIPVARRTFFELRRVSPLQNPLRNAFGVRGNVEIYPLEGATYSLDGESWLSYEDPDADPQEDDFLSAFNDLLNMETVSVTVRADGEVEWEEGEIDDQYAEKVRLDLLAATGAGTPDEWAAWTRKMLLDTFNADEEDAQADIPVPVAVRLDIPKDALSDPDPLSQTFIESEVTFDGENWRDLYDEEVPQELLLAIAQLKKE